MAKQLFRDGTEVVGFYVRTVKNGPFVFVSGTTSLDARGRVQGKDAAEQTTVIMRKVEAALKSAGGRLKDLVRLTIFVTDIREMPAISMALDKALKGSAVAAAMIGVSALATPGLQVEIEATAMLAD
jgi:2-iminobutanoate/2-iminopropanoate deaminase